MNNCAEITDAEINLAVARIVSVDGAVERNDSGNVVLVHDYHNGICLGWKSVDYCNNWGDAGQVMLENGIGIYPSEGPDFMPWMASPVGSRLLYTDKNPLRAAMIVFLMMKDAEK